MKSPVLYLVSLIFLLSCEVEISKEQAATFIKFYGNYLNDSGADVVITDDGGYAIAGTSVTENAVTGMVLLVTDEYGNLLPRFPRYYSDGRNCGANTILKLDDGFLLCGYVMAEEAGGGSHEDIYIVKTDENGRVTWSNTYGGAGNENIQHAVRGNSGGFVIAGYREINNKKDYWIFSISENGTFIREVPQQTVQNTRDNMAEYLISIPEYGYLCVCTYHEDTYKGSNVFILSVNNDLNTPYNLSLGTDYNDFGKCIIRGEGNQFYVLGNTENASSGRTELAVYSIEMNGLKFGSSSVVATIQSDSADFIAEDFVLTGTGRLAIIGSDISDGNYNILLQFLDQGVPDGRINFGETGSQVGSKIIVTDDGGLLFVGTNAYEGNSMISLVKTNEEGRL
ncbi:MAG TPA: hypothetical protein ENN61_01100 [Bacteroidaceae bacterium]|nr:hypothetical protein [Bacteroidaceae bacterium]